MIIVKIFSLIKNKNQKLNISNSRKVNLENVETRNCNICYCEKFIPNLNSKTNVRYSSFRNLYMEKMLDFSDSLFPKVTYLQVDLQKYY